MCFLLTYKSEYQSSLTKLLVCTKLIITVFIFKYKAKNTTQMHRKDLVVTIGIITILGLITTAFIYSCIGFNNFKQNKSLITSLRKVSRGNRSSVYPELLTENSQPLNLQEPGPFDNQLTPEKASLNLAVDSTTNVNVIYVLSENIRNSKKYQTDKKEGFDSGTQNITFSENDNNATTLLIIENLISDKV